MITPLGRRALIKPEEKKTLSGLIIPDDAEMENITSRHGVIEALPTGDHDFKVGDTVLYENIGADYNEFKLVPFDYIQAVIHG